jgi:predicted RecA/RadA family phage recombinase
LKTQASRTVTVVDTTAPLISLKGASTMEIALHSVFKDPGATAHDACDGEFTATASGTVDVNKIGSYTLTYTAKDPSGNEATSVRRTVNV